MILFITKPVMGLLANLLEHGFAQIVEGLSFDDRVFLYYLVGRKFRRTDEIVGVRFLRDVLVAPHNIRLLHVKSGAFLRVRV